MKKRFVGPIKEDEWLSGFSDYFFRDNERNFVLFMTGVLTGLNMPKILNLKVKDITETHLIVQGKGKKDNERVIMHPTLKSVIHSYIKGKGRERLLFPSREKTVDGKEKPLSIRQVHRLLKSAGKEIGYEENIGTLSLRKTFGYRHYKQYEDLGMLKEIFNHSTEKETKEFIGVSNSLEEKEDDWV